METAISIETFMKSRVNKWLRRKISVRCNASPAVASKLQTALQIPKKDRATFIKLPSLVVSAWSFHVIIVYDVNRNQGKKMTKLSITIGDTLLSWSPWINGRFHHFYSNLKWAFKLNVVGELFMILQEQDVRCASVVLFTFHFPAMNPKELLRNWMFMWFDCDSSSPCVRLH